MAFVKNLVVENARVIFRNFEGKETKFNRKGDRNFCVLFDKEQGEELKAQGWNLKILQPRDEEDEPAYCLSVKVMFGKIPPKVYMIANRKKTLLDEETIGLLDHAEIENADLIIRPYTPMSSLLWQAALVCAPWRRFRKLKPPLRRRRADSPSVSGLWPDRRMVVFL